MTKARCKVCNEEYTYDPLDIDEWNDLLIMCKECRAKLPVIDNVHSSRRWTEDLRQFVDLAAV